MRYREFLSGSFPSQAFTANQEQTVNWYPERRKNQDGVILLPVPGVEPRVTVFDGVGRAHLSIAGREFAVCGDLLFEVFDTPQYSGATALGFKFQVQTNIYSDDKATTPITLVTNGDLGSQLLTVTDEGAYYTDLTSKPAVGASAIAALTGKSTMGGYLDGYGLVLDDRTSTLYISNLGDFSTWDTGTDFAQRSLAPDPWKAMKVAGRYVWMFGEFTTEIWQDTGERFPFAPIPSALMDWGIKAQYSAVATGGNDVCWLAQNKSGRVAVVRAGGVNPQVVSTPALEYQINQYSDASGAVGDTYSWNGHTFYLLHFDTDKVTWCYDITTGEWHQRGTWDPENGEYLSWSPRWFVYAFNEVRCLDRMVATPADEVDLGTTPAFVYALSKDFNVDVQGKEIRRVRKSPVLVGEDKRVQYREFQVLMDVGEANAKETLATVSVAGQTASVVETTLFTVGSKPTAYVVSMDQRITLPTADYNTGVTVNWYEGELQKSHAFNSISENTDRRQESVSIRADAFTDVSYSVSYTSTVGAMEYDLDLEVYIPGVTDPQVMLRYSDDGGKTWSNEKWASAGKTGEYNTRVHWHRLGMGRRRVFELAVSDPIQWNLTDCFIDVEPGRD